jgi:RHS repeat-associated protein
VARFSYDPAGRRVESIEAGAAASYLYGGADVLRETRAGATLSYVQGLRIDEPLASDDGTALAYYHADALGSITTITDAAGAVASSRRYDPWGVVAVGEDDTGYAFTGREWSRGASLYYYRARYYDPRGGRFIAEDPIGFAGGLNLYAYVANNPALGTDPTGLIGIRECFARMGGAAGAMYANWRRMEDAHVPNVDWYFHCMANCEVEVDPILRTKTGRVLGVACSVTHPDGTPVVAVVERLSVWAVGAVGNAQRFPSRCGRAIRFARPQWRQLPRPRFAQAG